MILAQTHILFALLALLALLCARRNRPGWAGALLALAAAVKITPAFLLFYWLGNRRWRASVSFGAGSLALAALSLILLGWPLNHAYLRNLTGIANILLVSWNNQSLAGWWMGFLYPSAEQSFWHSLPLPPALKWTSELGCLLSCLFGGFLDTHLSRQAVPPAARVPPYGAAFAILGITVFTPIAWTHYYVLLILPFMLLLDAARHSRSAREAALLCASLLLIFALNFDTDSFDLILQPCLLFSIVHAQFGSALLAMAALLFAASRSTPAGKPLPHRLSS